MSLVEKIDEGTKKTTFTKASGLSEGRCVHRYVYPGTDTEAHSYMPKGHLSQHKCLLPVTTQMLSHVCAIYPSIALQLVSATALDQSALKGVFHSVRGMQWGKSMLMCSRDKIFSVNLEICQIK